MKTDAIEHQIEVYRGYAATYSEDSPERKDCTEAADQMEAELTAIETALAAKDEALRNLQLSADSLQCKLDQSDPDVIAVRLDIDEADVALTTPTGKVLSGEEKAKHKEA